jgi:hypothetical protein
MAARAPLNSTVRPRRARVSMDLFVILAAAQAPDVDPWNRALAATQSPATLVEVKDLSTHSGFLPVVVAGQRTGFEFYRSESLSDLVAHYSVLSSLKVERPVVYQLTYHGDFRECAAAFYSASVLVSKFGGTALESQGGVLMGASDLFNAAKECEKLASEERK